MDNKNDAKGMLGCLVLALYGLLGIVASVVVGIFFGVGFGFLAFALYLFLSFVICALCFSRLG